MESNKPQIHETLSFDLDISARLSGRVSFIGDRPFFVVACDLAVVGSEDLVSHHETPIPLAKLRSVTDFERFVESVKEWVTSGTWLAATDEIQLHVQDSINLAIVDVGLADVKKEDWVRSIIKDHTALTAQRLGEMAGVEFGRGQRSLWQSTDLTSAVAAALERLPKNCPRTLDRVAKELRESYPDRGPASGDALGHLMRRLSVNWMSLKKRK